MQTKKLIARCDNDVKATKKQPTIEKQKEQQTKQMKTQSQNEKGTWSQAKHDKNMTKKL